MYVAVVDIAAVGFVDWGESCRFLRALSICLIDSCNQYLVYTALCVVGMRKREVCAVGD